MKILLQTRSFDFYRHQKINLTLLQGKIIRQLIIILLTMSLYSLNLEQKV